MAAPAIAPTGPPSAPPAMPAAAPVIAAPTPVPTGWEPGSPLIGSGLVSAVVGLCFLAIAVLLERILAIARRWSRCKRRAGGGQKFSVFGFQFSVRMCV